MKKILNSFLVLFVVGCTGAKLELQPSPQVLSATTMSATYCSKLGRSAQQALKVVFVVDMSMSNIGKFVGNRFDTSSSTDLKQARLDAVEKFITDCGALNPNNQYAVIGFSNGIVDAQGSESCGRPFVTTAADGIASVRSLRNIQDANVAYYSSGSATVIKDMAETDYSKALDCAQTKVTFDLARSPKTNPAQYHVFFLTDGKPNPDVCNGKSECYGQKVDLLVNEVAGAGSAIKVQPVYYGREDERAQALKFLSPIAEAGKVDQVVVASDMKTLKLCDLASQPVQVRFRKESLSVVNLTSKMVQNTLMSDSDMDGIPDDQEVAQGYDPLKKRTFGIIDSACKSLGGPNICKSLQLSCKNIGNNLGLSDCDIQSLKLNSSASPSPGIDSDGDGIPDYVEVLRETLPSYNDGASDLDGDGMTNRVEIARGSQPNFPDGGLPNNLLMSYQEYRVQGASGCSSDQEAWYLNISHIPLVKVKAYTEDVTPPPAQAGDYKFLDLSHEQDENVILIYFKSVPENSPTSNAEIWGVVIRVPYDPRRQRTNYSLSPSDFHLLGEVIQ